jgi:large subunit ribosomal protein L14
MSQGRGRGKASKGVLEFRPYVTRVIPVGARVICADNTGAKTLVTYGLNSSTPLEALPRPRPCDIMFSPLLSHMKQILQ